MADRKRQPARLPRPARRDAADRGHHHRREPARRRAVRLHQPAHPARAMTALAGFMRHYARGQGGGVGFVLVALLLVSAAFAPVLAPHEPLAQARDAILQAPGWPYPLGTDDVGRDVLARLLYGARL